MLLLMQSCFANLQNVYTKYLEIKMFKIQLWSDLQLNFSFVTPILCNCFASHILKPEALDELYTYFLAKYLNSDMKNMCTF